ncbi:MAG: FxsA family protein [Bdellovibrionia bacterium]
MFFILWFALEVFVFFKFVGAYGFGSVFLSYLFPTLIGILLTMGAGRIAIMNLQGLLSKGQMPQAALLHSAAVFLGGVLLIPPTFTLRVVGVILLVPGLRHLAIWYFKYWLAKKMAKGGANFFQFGKAGNFQFYSFGSATKGWESAGPTRDVTPASQDILDVKPVSITHESKLESSEPSERKDY